jgi:RHS repeat-associated protein
VYGTRAQVPELAMHGDTAYRVVSDPLGSVRALVRASDGLVTWWRDYDAWGNVLATGGGNGPSLGYAGGLTDAATGLVRFGARDYDPGVGRWTTKDPIGFAGGEGSLYTYAGLDPIDATDPSGLAFRGHLPNDDVLRRYGLCRKGKASSRGHGAADDDAYTWDDFFDTSLHGLEAFADGFVPFWDPFAAHGAYNPHDPTYGPSKEIGVLTRDVEIAILLNARGRMGFDKKPHDFGGSIGKQPHFQIDVWLDRVKGSENTMRIPLHWWKP